MAPPLALTTPDAVDPTTPEVVEAAVNNGAQKAISDNDLRPALRPEIAITSYQEGGDLQFTVQVEVLPEVEVQDLSGLKLERPAREQVAIPAVKPRCWGSK